MIGTPAAARRRPTRRRRAGRHPTDRGSSPVEFAIIALPMIVLSFVVVQAGLVYFAQSIALGAATQGVNAARGQQADTNAGTNRAEAFLAAAGAGLEGQQVTVTRTATEVQVTVRGRAISLLPGLTWTITKSAHGPVERPTTP